jgi:hypothetical protein
MTKFRLVNPSIVGSANKSISASNEHDAASEAWNNLSQYITNNVPKFPFSIERTSDGKLFHFLVKEKRKAGSKVVDFSISPLSVKLTKSQLAEIKGKIENIHTANDKVQSGGKHKHHHDKDKKDSEDDSSSSSSSASDSSDSDVYNKMSIFGYNTSYPIAYWWYSPTLYSLDTVYIPTFTVPLTPYVELYYPAWHLGSAIL